MGFFTPWFLAGLVALGLPLWLHLLRQFKRTPQPFSSLMFFERQIQSSSKHRRLRYLTLLLLRLALLLLLALLFANPFVVRSTSAVTPRRIQIVVLDRSFSMRFQNNFADMKAQVSSFVQRSNGRRIQLFALDSHTVALTQADSNQAAVLEEVNALQPTDDESSYGEFARTMRVLEQTSGLALDIDLFTDVQQTSLPAAFTDLRVGPHSVLSIHPVGTSKSPNFGVESVAVPFRTYNTAGVRLTAGIAGWQTDSATRRVSVLLDGKKISSKDVTVPASGRAEITFDDIAIPFGAHRGEVQIEPHDDLPRDDSFPFSIEHADPRKVLFLTASRRAAEGFFYKSAMDASLSSGLSSSGLKVQVQSLAETAGVDFSPYALVVLNNPGELSDSFSRGLADYVTKGGSALIAIGPATTAKGAVPLSNDRVSATGKVQHARISTSEMFSSNVFDQAQFITTPQIKLGLGDKTLASFDDSCPLLVEQQKGEGKVVLFASTLDNSTSDFPTHRGYLPFVATISAYLAGDLDESSTVVVGNAITLRQTGHESNSADVINPEGKHEFPLSEATRIMSFKPNVQGFYDVHTASGRHRLLAVHADRRESNLERIPADTLNLWRNTNSDRRNELPTTTATNTPFQFSLWRYLLIFVLIAALVESVFATRYLGEESQAS